MIQLLFQQGAIPRTTTREEWRKIDRWRRETTKRLRADAEQGLATALTLGVSHPGIMEDYINRAVNPPVLIYPPLPPKKTLTEYDD